MSPDIVPNKIYTYSDYITYGESEPIEIIEGGIYNMCPAPSRIHQKLINELAYILTHHIKSNNGLCEVYSAPFDVILKNNDEDISSAKNVVQPDISIICDKSKLTDKGCTGSPDFIIEIVSPYNISNDYIRKAYLYEKYSVKEYWIVNPMNRQILVYTLGDNGYNAPNVYTFVDKIKVYIFNELEIDFKSITL